jgi:hypothetical protein
MTRPRSRTRPAVLDSEAVQNASPAVRQFLTDLLVHGDRAGSDTHKKMSASKAGAGQEALANPTVAFHEP